MAKGKRKDWRIMAVTLGGYNGQRNSHSKNRIVMILVKIIIPKKNKHIFS